MTGFVLRRMSWAAVVLLVVGTLSFLLTFVAPGDPARAIGGMKSTPQTVASIRAALGLDRPPLDQLLAYYGRLITLDLGHSFKQDLPVLDLILARLPATIELAVAGLGLALLIGIPLGVASARHPGSRTDRLGAVFSSTFVSIPAFVLGLAAIYVLAFLPSHLWHIKVFPIGTRDFSAFDVRQLVLPALVLGLVSAPFYVRVTRTSMLDELHHDYVRTARAKGLRDREVAWRHAFRNALTPIVSQIGLDLGFFLGGVVVIEYIFGWPGIGRQAVMAITGEDLPLLMGTVLFATLCVVLANLGADIVQVWLDPRIEHWRHG